MEGQRGVPSYQPTVIVKLETRATSREMGNNLTPKPTGYVKVFMSVSDCSVMGIWLIHTNVSEVKGVTIFRFRERQEVPPK
jgi:hypothetical protein